MYLAPLNYDRYFKRVFSDLEIAKHFLSDFLDVEIETIEPLKTQHHITDDAASITFDFRCKINGQYVIIDMQQWYKTDVVKRFYVYHAANSALQLENLPFKTIFSVPNTPKREKRPRDYQYIEPVLTLVWMADDTLDFKGDYITYRMQPDTMLEFVRNRDLWHDREINAIMEARALILQDLDRAHKNLDFLSKNQLVFAFQKNIVRNEKYAKYFKWFDLAEKTRKKDNEANDFDAYIKDEVLVKVINRLRTNKKDLTYIRSADQRQEEALRWFDSYKIEMRPEMHAELRPLVREEVMEEVREEVKEEVREEVKEEVREEVKEEVREEVKEEVREEVKEEVREEVKEEVREEVIREIRAEQDAEIILKLHKKGKKATEIADLLDISVEIINRIIQIG
jgi:hypothetical protein